VASLNIKQSLDMNFATATHPMPPDAELWGSSIQKPYPTGAWWLNFVLPGAPYPAASYPYAVKAQNDGLAISYSATRRMVRQKLYADVFAPGTHDTLLQLQTSTMLVVKSSTNAHSCKCKAVQRRSINRMCGVCHVCSTRHAISAIV
jgi:endoglucanase Acf2